LSASERIKRSTLKNSNSKCGLKAPDITAIGLKIKNFLDLLTTLNCDMAIITDIILSEAGNCDIQVHFYKVNNNMDKFLKIGTNVIHTIQKYRWEDIDDLIKGTAKSTSGM